MIINKSLIGSGFLAVSLLIVPSPVLAAEGVISPAEKAELRHDRREIHRDKRENRQDRREIHGDRKEIRADRKELIRDRHELRRDLKSKHESLVFVIADAGRLLENGIQRDAGVSSGYWMGRPGVQLAAASWGEGCKESPVGRPFPTRRSHRGKRPK